MHIGPIRETHFERIFDVLSRAAADSDACTSAAVPECALFTKTTLKRGLTAALAEVNASFDALENKTGPD